MDDEIAALRKTVERLERNSHSSMVEAQMLQHVIEVLLTYHLAPLKDPISACDELAGASLRDLHDRYADDLAGEGMERFRAVVEEITTHEVALWASVRRQLAVDP